MLPLVPTPPYLSEFLKVPLLRIHQRFIRFRVGPSFRLRSQVEVEGGREPGGRQAARARSIEPPRGPCSLCPLSRGEGLETKGAPARGSSRPDASLQQSGLHLPNGECSWPALPFTGHGAVRSVRRQAGPRSLGRAQLLGQCGVADRRGQGGRERSVARLSASGFQAAPFLLYLWLL